MRFFSALLVVSTIACNNNNETKSYPNSEEGVKQIAAVFMKGGSEAEHMLKNMKPSLEDCKMIMVSEADAKKLSEMAEMMFTQAKASEIAPKTGQTEILVRSATTENLKAGTDKEMPGGYTDKAAKFKEGLRIYGFKFVKPGETIGMAYDGLYYVNNKWIFLPKTWRYLE